MSGLGVPPDAVALRLGKFFPGDDLRFCETCAFEGGATAIDTVLRRAALSGRVEIDADGLLPDYIADMFDDNFTCIGTIALDRNSFRALKNHWMRCKYEEADERNSDGTAPLH